MPHIDFQNDLPGIRSALAYSPQTAEDLPLDRPGDDVWKEFPLPVSEQ
ncbi:MAG TPA: hypothetical protein VFP87_05170 [Chitinophagaceae bacterium]|nr:hypothetical protein [Chitinophagaceae bacterium]